MATRLFATLILCLGLLLGPAWANDTDSWGDVDAGLDEDPFAAADAVDTVSMERAPDSPFHFGGFLEITTEIGFNKEQDRLSSLRPLLHLEAEYRFNDKTRVKVSARGAHEAAYDLTDRPTPGDQGQDDAQWEGELWDAFVDAELSPGIRLRAGRQTIAWGESNYARILDFFTPRDMTRPGLMELEDARMPSTALRLTAQTDLFTLEGVSLHEFPGDKISGLGADFDPFSAYRKPGITILDKTRPETDLAPQGFGVKLTKSFNAMDFALVGGRSYDPTPVLGLESVSPLGELTLRPEFHKMSLAGLSASRALGSLLLKMEGVYRWDRAVQRTDIAQQVAHYSALGQPPVTQVKEYETKDQIEVLAGLEYTGITDLVLLAEAQCLKTLDHESNLVLPRYQYRTYFQANYLMWHETLEWELFWAWLNPGQGHILRFSGEYDFTDAFGVELGTAFYFAGDSDTAVHAYKDMDRVFCRLTYSF